MRASASGVGGFGLRLCFDFIAIVDTAPRYRGQLFQLQLTITVVIVKRMRSRLKELRQRAGLTQVELSEKAGITQSTVSKIESGRGDGDEDTLGRIAAVLGVSVADLVAEDDAPIVDAQLVPSMSSRPGWTEVLARAKTIAPEVDADSWARLERAPGMFASDLPLTPAVVADLGRVVMRHAPPKR